MKLRDSENIYVLGGFLGAVSIVAALMLALVSQWTGEPIKNALENNRSKVFHRLMLPEFDCAGREINIGKFVFIPLQKGDDTIGFVGQGSIGGYGGNIEILVGFDLSGKITAVQVLRHKETPGLGAKVCERKFQRTVLNLAEVAPDVPGNELLDQFNGKSAFASGNWRISKDGGDFIYLTGATVTSRAITELVNDMAKVFSDSALVGGEK